MSGLIKTTLADRLAREADSIVKTLERPGHLGRGERLWYAERLKEISEYLFLIATRHVI